MRLVDVDFLAQFDHWQKVVKDLSVAPTVDAVRVVRCRECKYCDIYDEICQSCGDVDERCGVCKYTGICARFDGYCSHGKRRSE